MVYIYSLRNKERELWRDGGAEGSKRYLRQEVVASDTVNSTGSAVRTSKKKKKGRLC